MVVGFGENSIDYIYRVPRLPGANAGKVRVLSRTLLPGGQVATTMAACRALGLEASYVGTFGNDEAGQQVCAELQRRGVDVRHSMVRDAPNRHALIFVDDRNGDRAVFWDRDAKLAIQEQEVRPGWFAGAQAIHVDAVDEAASIAAARLGRAAGAMVTCDIDTVTANTDALLAAVTVPILAEELPHALTGEPDLERALRQLRQRHAGTLVVTLGARGAMMLVGDRLIHQTPPYVTAVDTTGAGDIFRAGFICGSLRGLTGADLLRFANATAAISCTRHGAMSSVPTLEEVLALAE